MSEMLKELNEHWAVVEPVLSISDEAEYEAAMARVDALIDEGALNPEHPLHSLLNVLGTLIHAYEERHHPMPAISSVQMLRFLMEQHGLKQTDLPEIGTQSVVSEILRGKRTLNVRQIARLAARFHVPADVFMDHPAR